MPNDIGIGVYGALARPVEGVRISRNTIGGRAGPFFQSWAIELSHVRRAKLAANVVPDARFGFSLHNSREILVSDTHFSGKRPLEIAFDFSGSSSVTVRNTRSTASVATPVTSRGPGIHFEDDAGGHALVPRRARGRKAEVFQKAIISLANTQWV